MAISHNPSVSGVPTAAVQTAANCQNIDGIYHIYGNFTIPSGSAGNMTITFPKAFKDNYWSLAFADNSTLALTKPLFFDTATTTTFRVWYPTTTEAHLVNYIAIGKAP